MKRILLIALLLGMVACAATVSYEQERDGGIGGTGIETGAIVEPSM